MQAIHMAAGAIQLDAGEAFICAGIESMSRVPMAGFNPLLHPGLAERFPAAYISMGETAENVARRHQITRRRQEELAVESHRRAAAARAEGRLRDAIVPVSVSGEAVEQDGCIRPDPALEALAELKTAFATHGRVTDATSPPQLGSAPCRNRGGP